MPQLTPQRAKVAQLRFQGHTRASALREMRLLYPEANVGKHGVNLWFDRAESQLLKVPQHTRVRAVPEAWHQGDAVSGARMGCRCRLCSQ